MNISIEVSDELLLQGVEQLERIILAQAVLGAPHSKDSMHEIAVLVLKAATKQNPKLLKTDKPRKSNGKRR